MGASGPETGSGAQNSPQGSIPATTRPSPARYRPDATSQRNDLVASGRASAMNRCLNRDPNGLSNGRFDKPGTGWWALAAPSGRGGLDGADQGRFRPPGVPGQQETSDRRYLWSSTLSMPRLPATVAGPFSPRRHWGSLTARKGGAGAANRAGWRGDRDELMSRCGRGRRACSKG